MLLYFEVISGIDKPSVITASGIQKRKRNIFYPCSTLCAAICSMTSNGTDISLHWIVIRGNIFCMVFDSALMRESVLFWHLSCFSHGIAANLGVKLYSLLKAFAWRACCVIIRAQPHQSLKGAQKTLRLNKNKMKKVVFRNLGMEDRVPSMTGARGIKS